MTRGVTPQRTRGVDWPAAKAVVNRCLAPLEGLGDDLVLDVLINVVGRVLVIQGKGGRMTLDQALELVHPFSQDVAEYMELEWDRAVIERVKPREPKA